MTEPEKKRPKLGDVLVLVCLVGGVVVLGLLGASWVDRKSSIPKNERKASTALKMLATAEADYRANDRDGNKVQDYWTADVAGLWHSGRMIPRGVAEADAKPLKALVDVPVPYHGYYFKVLERDDQSDITYNMDTDGSGRKTHNSTRFGFCAYPVEYDSTGRWTFIINENNTIFKFQQGEPFKDNQETGQPVGDIDIAIANLAVLRLEQLLDLRRQEVDEFGPFHRYRLRSTSPDGHRPVGAAGPAAA